jgi:uncharacterized protein YdaU (DUF1376 family)
MASSSDRPPPLQLPYYPKYVDDWLSSLTIAGLTLEQEGAYDRLLMHQWKSPDCSLPDSDQTLAQYSRLGARWRKVGRPIIDACFVAIEGGRLRNEKLYQLWLDAQDKSVKARAAADARWTKVRQGRLPMSSNGGDNS